MANFDVAYNRTAQNEGGYANLKGDTGGETYAGISRRNFPKWEGWKIIDAHKPLKQGQFIKNTPALDAAVKNFYKKVFWDAVCGDKVEDQNIANTLYDFGVNAGHPRSIADIQKALGMPANGKIDNRLITAINNPEKYV